MTLISLPRSLDITGVSAVSTELVNAIALGELTLDAGAVARVDAAGLQLLCAAAMAARARGTGLRWRGVPAALRDGARILGLTELLALPAAAPAGGAQEIR